MQILTIDRFEGEYAVCEKEDCTFISIEKNLLPAGAKEGSIINVNDDGKMGIDEQREAERREMLFKMQENLFSE